MKVEKRVLYFVEGEQVLQITRGLAAELGLSETTLRKWAKEPNFPDPVYTETWSEGKFIHYYPYTPAVAWLEERMKSYREIRARGIGRPSNAIRSEEKVRERPA